MPEGALCDWLELYVLDGLDADERRRYEVHLAQCPHCQAEVAHLRGVTAALLESTPDLGDPPPGMRDRVLAEVFAADGAAKRPRRGVQGLARLAVAAALLLLGMGIGRNWPGPRPPVLEVGTVVRRTALVAQPGHPGRATAYLVRRGGGELLVLSAIRLAEPKDGQVYQVWFLLPGGVESAGTFVPTDRGAGLFVAPLPAGGQVRGVAVTLEPRFGDLQPLGPKVLVGLL